MLLQDCILLDAVLYSFIEKKGIKAENLSIKNYFSKKRLHFIKNRHLHTLYIISYICNDHGKKMYEISYV